MFHTACFWLQDVQNHIAVFLLDSEMAGVLYVCRFDLFVSSG
jgi:hypothetical protein